LLSRTARSARILATMTSRPSAAFLAAALAALSACAPAAAPAPSAAQAAAPKIDPAAEAYAARKAKDFAKAEAIASAEIDAGRGGARLYFERGVARMELGKKEEALADLKKVNEIQEDPAALLLAGSVELQLAKWQDAEKDLARAVALQPSNARAWASLAQARLALRDLPGAKAAHEKAAALAPSDPYVREVGERIARVAPKAADPAGDPAVTPAAQPVPQPAAAGAAPPKR
jgi:tetratricopeptide (TPR) repeat protein